MKKTIFIIFIVVLSSCKLNSDSNVFLDYIPNEDRLNLFDTFKKIDTSKFKIDGSYINGDKCVCSMFRYDNLYEIEVIKFYNVSNDFKIVYKENEQILEPGFYNNIVDTENCNLLYDTGINNDNEEINQIEFISNGNLKVTKKDKLRAIYMDSNKFSLKINRKNSKTFIGNLEPNSNNIILVENNFSLYLFIIQPIIKEKIKGMLLNEEFYDIKL